MTAADDYYFDNLLLVREPGGGRIGPARARQAEWWSTARSIEVAAAPSEAAAVALALRQGLVVTRAQARDCGLDDARIRSLLRRRRWTSPRRSVLCPLPPTATPGRPSGRSAEILAAAVALVRPGSVISHESAARIHGLPLLAEPLRPTLTVPEAEHVAGRSDALIRAAPFEPGELSDWFGASVLSVARTVVDVARSSGAGAGLVVADAALAERLTTPDELRAVLVKGRARPGGRTAARIVHLASPLAESPLESLTRLCLHDAGLPAPRLQRWVETDSGRVRVDMMWAEQRVIVEVDGRLKYEGPDKGRLWKEKLRQEALERAGFTVVRLVWAEVVNAPRIAIVRVARALGVPVPGSR